MIILLTWWPTNEPNSNKPTLMFSVPYNTNTTQIGSILRKYSHLIDQDPSLTPVF
jgi:hypothetical protein